MDTTIVNSEFSKNSDPHRPLTNLIVKISLKRKDKFFA